MPSRFPSLPNATLGSEDRNFQLGKLNLFTKGNAPSLLSECGFAEAAPEFHNHRRGRSCQGTLPFSVRNLPGKSIQGYSAKYPRILRNLSKDKRASIQGYFFRVVWSSLFQISLDTFPIHKLNQWTVLWKPYWISWRIGSQDISGEPICSREFYQKQ